MDTVTRVQILDEPVYISYSNSTLGKGINPAFGQIAEQTELFNIGMATSLGEGKLWIQTC